MAIAGRRSSGSSTSATVSTASAAASSPAAGQSMPPARRWRARPGRDQTPARQGSAIGRLSQNTQRQPSHSVMAPPHNGPSSAPASEAAAIAPSPSMRRAGVSSSTTIAIATGTTAPPPTAWSARAITSHSNVGATATSALPSMNSTSAAPYTRT